jgi:hypothetical protein
MAVIESQKSMPLFCLDIEIAVAKYFGWRQHLIVPNVSWGLGLTHEADILVVTRSGYATEIEIKTSAQDLKRDLLKSHKHRSEKIRQRFAAVPTKLKELALQTFPEDWGVLSISEGPYVERVREAKKDKTARALNVNEINHLYELASMRIWTLKETLANRIQRTPRSEAG